MMEEIKCENCGTVSPRFKIGYQVLDTTVDPYDLDEVKTRKLNDLGLFSMDFCDRNECREIMIDKYFRTVLKDRVELIKKI